MQPQYAAVRPCSGRQQLAPGHAHAQLCRERLRTVYCACMRHSLARQCALALALTRSCGAIHCSRRAAAYLSAACLPSCLPHACVHSLHCAGAQLAVRHDLLVAADAVALDPARDAVEVRRCAEDCCGVAPVGFDCTVSDWLRAACSSTRKSPSVSTPARSAQHPRRHLRGLHDRRRRNPHDRRGRAPVLRRQSGPTPAAQRASVARMQCCAAVDVTRALIVSEQTRVRRSARTTGAGWQLNDSGHQLRTFARTLSQ